MKQREADRREANAGLQCNESDEKSIRRLRHTSGRERAHRDRGQMRDTERLQTIRERGGGD